MNKEYIKPLSELFAANANPLTAVPMKRYMRDQFEYFGIQTPKRKALQKEFLQKHGLPTGKQLPGAIKTLWELPQRECQYSAIEIFAKIMKSQNPLPIPPQEMIELIEYVITTKSWWDSVDAISTQVVAVFFQKYPDYIKPRTDKWRLSGNIWLQRTTILFQLQFKEKTDENLLFDTIRQFTNSNEFFIQKAIGWGLREYSKKYPQKVKDFIQQTTLAPLSKREALKIIEKK